MPISNVRLYWNRSISISLFVETLPLNVFEKIRQFLHFNDNSLLVPRNEPGHDRMHKIRPVIETIRKRFNSIPVEERVACDEQMCSSKARHFLIRYMPKKPNKYGFILYLLSGMSGFSYNFEVYTGQEGEEERLPNEPDIGATGNTVVRLTRILKPHQNHKIYFDNYYTSISLCDYLLSQGVHCVGTVRTDRIPDCPLPDKKTQKSMVRGQSVEYVGEMKNGKIAAVSWKDNKCVNLLSTFAGVEPETKVRRYDRSRKLHVEVNCPSIISEYNRHMGGVDLLDSLLGRYKIIQRSKKWYIRLFYHLLDLTVVNAWLIYVRVHKERQEPHLKLAMFRLQLAQSLCKFGMTTTPTRGRPSLASKKPKKAVACSGPPKEVRLDNIGHWPDHTEKKQRCKMEQCKGFTVIKCVKCTVPLCLNKTNNCFVKYHTL
ncbi:piggyBac transposable element-derived protein 2-like [Homalodisca vitripennis]|uniref:piggyBac transposable element-derived protein 2-like n=1 Tax=Homalodisca vitripennis TaxID=197043 RepID=UPI001EEB74F2|nr:piggyBac transposable element-derived protein 2-like [Homalodisca vitripennis]